MLRKNGKWAFGALLAAVLALTLLWGGFAPQEAGSPAAQGVQTVLPQTQEEPPAQEAETPKPVPAEEQEAAPPESGEQPSPPGEAGHSAEASGAAPAVRGKEAASPGGEEPALFCTVSISCASMLARLDACGEGTAALVPEDGWLLPPTKAAFSRGESAFDLLKRVCREQGIHLEYSDTPVYDSAYIEGIGNIYEYDAGALSGWMYKVNGNFPNYGCSSCLLADGDEVCWVYTCELGADIGGRNAAG